MGTSSSRVAPCSETPSSIPPSTLTPSKVAASPASSNSLVADRPAITVSISTKQDSFLQGELIHGHVVLDLEVDSTITSLDTMLRYTQTHSLFTAPIHQHTSFPDLLNSLKVFSKGHHRVPFTCNAPSSASCAPSTCSLEAATGDPTSGIAWSLQAFLTINDQVYMASHPINLFAAPRTPRSLNSAFLVSEANIENMRLRVQVPSEVPHPPALCKTTITMEPRTPTFVQKVSLSLVSRIVLWQGAASAVYEYRELIGEAKLAQLVTSSLEVDGASLGWRLQRHHPRSFATPNMYVTHDLVFELLDSSLHSLWLRSTIEVH